MNNIKKRFAITLGTNIVKAFLGFLVGMLLARGLGAEDYGRFSFLLATFLSFTSLLDMGTSSAFFTFISKSKQSKEFYFSYFLWIALQFIVSVIFLYFIIPEKLLHTLFVGESRGYITLAFIAVFFQQAVWNLLSQLSESSRDTVSIQKLNLGIGICNFLAVFFLYQTHNLNVVFVLSLIITQYILALIIFKALIFEASKVVDANIKDNLFSIFKRFRIYCGPLVLYSWVGFGYQFFDVWMLQHYSGAEDQAYFAVSSKIAAVSLIFTTSIIRVFWKEIGAAENENDKQKVYLLYKTATRTFYTLSAILCGFLLPWAKDIISVLLGDGYESAAVPFSIMLLYPVHQSLGQINGTMFYAIEEIKAHVKISIIIMFLSVAISYLLLSDQSGFISGLSLGAEGLALKMVGMQWLSVNIGMFVISKIKGWKFDWFYQVYILGTMLGLGYFAYYIVNQLDLNFYILFVLAGLIYIILLLGVLYLFSKQLLNMKRTTIKLRLKLIFSP
ncbi:MAG: oligosaccharide flippase family protein [Candidatus Endonucleobacter sp. (ex Gigantidas childressi)]|nr:oligosaccharide flippase family protein [Candidatus Endonucleobacter sp. (ex Gigantidas childressi)]